MLLCGFHWHSRYSIWISTFVLLDSVCFRAIVCGSQEDPLVHCIKISLNAKCLLHFRVNFMFLINLVNSQ